MWLDVDVHSSVISVISECGSYTVRFLWRGCGVCYCSCFDTCADTNVSVLFIFFLIKVEVNKLCTWSSPLKCCNKDAPLCLRYFTYFLNEHRLTVSTCLHVCCALKYLPVSSSIIQFFAFFNFIPSGWLCESFKLK